MRRHACDSLTGDDWCRNEPNGGSPPQRRKTRPATVGAVREFQRYPRSGRGRRLARRLKALRTLRRIREASRGDVEEK